MKFKIKITIEGLGGGNQYPLYLIEKVLREHNYNTQVKDDLEDHPVYGLKNLNFDGRIPDYNNADTIVEITTKNLPWGG